MKNKLLGIDFECNGFNFTQKILDFMWDDYSNKLYSKYSQFYSNSESSPNRSVFVDKETFLIIAQDETLGVSTLDIIYFDNELYSKKHKKDNSEL